MVEATVQQFNAKNPRTDNLTPGEKRGLTKLRKRVKDGEIVIYESDKSGKLCCATPEVYKKQGDQHTVNDTVVDWKTVEDSLKDMKGLLRALNLIFQAGENQGEGQPRVWQAKELSSTVIPIMSQLVKDHKPPKPDQEAPPTRPVCGASSSINGELSEWVSHIVDSANCAIDTR